jgi:hypothetical protein
VLLIPVREAETIVRQRALQVAPALLPRDHGLAAHITLLAPFMPREAIHDGVIGELDHFFADVISFGYRLAEVSEFPSGPTYLSPEPSDIFRRLAHGLHRLFPEFPPYGGQFGEIIPHLSVPLPDGEDTASLRTAVRRKLPIEAHATEAALVWSAEEDTHTMATFKFGTTAA